LIGAFLGFFAIRYWNGLRMLLIYILVRCWCPAFFYHDADGNALDDLRGGRAIKRQQHSTNERFEQIDPKPNEKKKTATTNIEALCRGETR